MLLDPYNAFVWGFRKARRWFNLFISVNPNIHEAIRKDRPLYSTQRQNNYKKRQDRFDHPLTEMSDFHDQLSEGLSSTTESIYDFEPPGASLVFPHIVPESVAEYAGAPRALRSTRQRKYRSINDTAIGTSKTQTPPLPQLRRTKRCISLPMSGNVLENCALTPQAPSQSDEDTPLDISNVDDNLSSYATAPTLLTHEEQSSGYSQYVTARTSFDCTLDSIDENSVMRFFNPSPTGAHDGQHPSGGIDELTQSNCEEYTTAHSNASTSALATSHGFTYRLNTPRLPIPSLMLTLPTPVIPSSPIFVTQSPITMPKYLTASSSTSGASSGPFGATSVLGIPSLPRCDCCGLAEFESGTQCVECDQQWLACKIWYQANDGGRKRYLTEPYIKPAESTARSRAILDVLGVPGGSPGPLGLGIEFETQSPRKRRFWRVSRLLSSVPIPDKLISRQALPLLDTTGETELTLLGNILENTSTRLGRLRIKIAALLASVQDHDLEGTDSLVAGSTRSPHQLVPSIPSFGPAECGLGDLVPLPGRIPCAESRFVEHLAEHLGNMVVHA